MAQTKREIQALLAAAGSHPRHRFGQNFMVDANVVRLIADAGELTSDHTAVEVGPGTGTLTEELLTRAGRVVAVEIDRDLAGLLRTRFADRPTFDLIEGDALDGKHALNPTLVESLRAAGPGRARLVANLPYNIASPLVVELLLEGVELLAFTVQREVAERLRASAGSGEYGPLTATTQLLADVEVLRVIPPGVFWPLPKIESALVRLRRRDRLGPDARGFARFAQTLFAYRRKTLRRALAEAGFEPDAMLGGLDPQQRPEMLPPDVLLDLFGRRVSTDGSTR